MEILIMSEHGTNNTNSSNEKVTDHDLLISLSNDMTWIKKMFSNHLAHHWVITICVAGSLLTAVGTLLLYIITSK